MQHSRLSASWTKSLAMSELRLDSERPKRFVLIHFLICYSRSASFSFIGLPTFSPPVFPAKDSARRFELVFSPLKRPGAIGNQNERFHFSFSYTKHTGIFTQK